MALKAPLAPAPPTRRRFPRNLSDGVWLLFVVWTAVGFIVMPLGITGAQARAWAAPFGLGDLAEEFLHISDAVWMLLAAVTVYLHAVASEGLTTARRQAGIILLASTVFEWIGARTGFPFGPYEYTGNFGPRIGGVVPMAIPLAWLVVVLTGRSLMLWLRPTAGRCEIAAGVAGVALLTDLNLEPVAWRIREYWLWYPQQPQHPPLWPPLQNYAAWLVLSFALALVLPADHSLRPRRPGRTRPILVLCLLNTLLAVVHLAAHGRLTEPVPERAAAHPGPRDPAGCRSTAIPATRAVGLTYPTAKECWNTRSA